MVTSPAGGTKGTLPVGNRPAFFGRLRREGLRAFAGAGLLGSGTSDLRLRIGPRWPGDAMRGAAIVSGEIELSGEVVRNPAPRWSPPGAGPEWLAAWHGFEWLADLALAGSAGRDAARQLVEDWIAANPARRGIGWRADVIGSRIYAWVAHFDEILGRNPDPELSRKVLASLNGQLRHLWRTAGWEETGAARIRAFKGLLAGVAALAGSEAKLAKAARLLAREIPAQVLADGGHRSRNPSTQLAVLRDLIDIRALLRTAKAEVPASLQGAIERMAPILRLFRHGDRRLALFNGSFEEDGVLIDLVLTQSEAKIAPPTHAPEIGFHRLHAGKTLVLLDAGKPPAHGYDTEAHAGALSFELSHERERIIVNCGRYCGARSRLSRASAAHSVLVVADTNSVEIRGDGLLGRAPATVASEHAEHDGQQWVAATHDGYRTRFGLIYSRQLFLSADGDDLRGEDKLVGRPGAHFAVRFHLHPAVQASLDPDGEAALLRLPSGARWRLRAAGANISLGESVYLGSGEPRKTQQVVLSGTVAASEMTVRWALRRAARRAGND